MYISNIVKKIANIKLIIFDINGVLDNLLQNKILLGKKVFGLDGIKLSEYIVGMDRIYEKNKGSDLCGIISCTLDDIGIKYTDNQINEFCSLYYKGNCIDNDIIDELMELQSSYKLCLYTSLRREHIPHLFGNDFLCVQFDIFSGEDFSEEKPSIKNLQTICLKYGVNPIDCVYYGDNIVADLMPAKLLGMKTVLVSHYVDELLNISIDFS